jgi:O-antigen/teichoic acid export membrane protein
MIRRNMLANFIGNGWTSLLNLALIPIYVQFLGIESYGLLGVFNILYVALNLLDVGLSPTLNRELARLSAQNNKTQEMRNLVRTIEIGYWALAMVICGIGVLFTPLISHYWLKGSQLSESEIQTALTLMVLVITFQWPISLYTGGLQGLQQQVVLNAINVGVATVRGGGSLLVLWLVSPTIQSFLVWQMLTSVCHTLLLACFLWRSLPRPKQKAQFSLVLFRNVWRFAAGMSSIAVVSVILSLMDKVILSRVLTLEKFGYYTLASTLAFSLQRLVAPIFDAAFPRFSQVVALGNEDQLKNLYHKTCQIMSVAILPVAGIIAVFSPQVLLLWTRNASTVENTYLLVSLLVTGVALNGLMNPPYALQLAHGWTKLAFYQNLVAIVILVPTTLIAVNRVGSLGAACVWVILNSGYIFVSVPIMHRKILRGNEIKWYLADVGMPLVGALSIIVISRWFLPALLPLPWLATWLVITFVTSFACATLATSLIREWLKQLITKQIKINGQRT